MLEADQLTQNNDLCDMMNDFENSIGGLFLGRFLNFFLYNLICKKIPAQTTVTSCTPFPKPFPEILKKIVPPGRYRY